MVEGGEDMHPTFLSQKKKSWMAGLKPIKFSA